MALDNKRCIAWCNVVSKNINIFCDSVSTICITTYIKISAICRYIYCYVKAMPFYIVK